MGSPRSDEQQDSGEGQSNNAQCPPAAPNPERDSGIVPTAKSSSIEDDDLSPENINIFTLKPVSALKLLCHSIDSLVQLTGDIPPTPPARTPTKSRSPTRSPFSQDRRESACVPRHDVMNLNLCMTGQDASFAHESIDGIPFKQATIGSPDSNPWGMNSPPHEDVGYNAQPLYVQHASLARKFYSKRPPPISTEEYLLRMHKYCPMSTAVYLATSLFITRLAITEKVLPVTPRNVHRLLLAGLRVSMKALEDLSWPHSRFAKVGGVSETELGRLEITFCFFTAFILKVSSEELQTEAEELAKVFRDVDRSDFDIAFGDKARRVDLKIPECRYRQAVSSAAAGTRTIEKRKASSALPNRPALHVGVGIPSSIEVVGQS